MAQGDVRMHTLTAEDQEFRRQFETLAISPAEFNHRAHLRLAYAYLAEHGVDESVDLMRAALSGFIRHHQIDPAKYHETLTRAWILAVRHFMERAGTTTGADDFLAKSTPLLDPAVMMTHYSKDRLFSAGARSAFVAPDLSPIPGH